MTVENIVAIYRLATPEEKRDGVVWYATALAECNRIALDYEVPLHIVVGVCAALSPNNRWERNIINTRDLVQAYTKGDGIESFKVSTYHTMKAKAWGIMDALLECYVLGKPVLTEAEVIAILNGQKIISFFQNIMGYDTCTIDGHARNIAYNVRESLTGSISIGKKEYATLQAEYVKAGKKVRLNGRALKAFEMQAITWVAWRRIHGIG